MEKNKVGRFVGTQCRLSYVQLFTLLHCPRVQADGVQSDTTDQ